MQRGVAGPIDGQTIDHGPAHMNVVEADLALLGQNRMDQVDGTAALDEPGGCKRNDGAGVQTIGADQRTSQGCRASSRDRRNGGAIKPRRASRPVITCSTSGRRPHREIDPSAATNWSAAQGPGNRPCNLAN